MKIERSVRALAPVNHAALVPGQVYEFCGADGVPRGERGLYLAKPDRGVVHLSTGEECRAEYTCAAWKWLHHPEAKLVL